MPTTDLLPGVTAAACPPAVVFDSRAAIKRARRKAIAHDVLDVALLAAVDYLFIRWPDTHVPLLDRGDSLVFLAAANAALVTYFWMARVMPRWSARRVATTWCLAERARFFSAERAEESGQHR